MRNFYFLVVFVLSFSSAKAQFVTIPDANFVAFLQTNYPSCMSGNQMDTTCIDIVNEFSVNCSYSGISNLEGIQYFDNLIELRSSNNSLVNIQNLLQSNLEYLDVSVNSNLVSLGTLPISLIEFKARYCNNLVLPTFHQGLEIIRIGNSSINNISLIPTLPNSLRTFSIDSNPLISIPNGILPDSLVRLDVANCNLSELPSLPSNLQYLFCSSNLFDTLGPFPPLLTTITGTFNPNLNYVFGFPDSMVYIRLNDCALNSVDTLPNIILSDLNLSNNVLTTLPNLPSHLSELDLSNNNLQAIPSLPISALEINLANNNISSLSNFPSNLTSLIASDNNISCWPIFPSTLNNYITITNNPFQCIPNYIPLMGSFLYASYFDTIPICDLSITGTNPFGCPTGTGITGNVFEDLQLDCQYSGSEAPVNNAQIKLYDDTGAFLALTSVGSSGRYYFSTPNLGTYQVVYDTTNKPITPSCVYPGPDSTVSISINDSLAENVDLGFVCKPGFDIGATGVCMLGAQLPVPGQTHYIVLHAGDLSPSSLGCASGVSGIISIQIDGPVSYEGIPTSALIDTVNGLTFSYNIADFANVAASANLLIRLGIDTTAQANDLICVTVNVTPVTGDNNPSNNTYSFCYKVLNSYDPNDKQVYPETVEPGYDDWLTYTIRFQNTGNSPAFNVRLEDTLSGLLDYETFEVIGFKHNNSYNLIDDRLIIYFPNIILPDSTSNFQGSIGYFQYRIKPISGLMEGTEIENTAYIFFDYNDPIITNTAITSFVKNDLSVDALNNIQMTVFPNPSTGTFYLKTAENVELNAIKAYSITGQSIPINFTQNTNLIEIEILGNTKGLCFINIITDKGTIVKKMMIE